MKKRGFTLVELLAVIVILAVIALIAVPVILGIIEGSRKQSIAISGKAYVDYIDERLQIEQLKDNIFSDGKYNVISSGKKIQLTPQEMNIKMNGTLPIDGWVIIKDCQIIEALLIFGKYEYHYKLENGKIIQTITKVGQVAPDVNLVLQSTTNSITATINNNDQYKINQYEYKLDDGNFVKSNSNQHIFTNLESDKEYTITVRCKNTTGGEITITETIRTKIIDAPSYSINPDSGWATKKTVTITYPQKSDILENPKYEYSLDSGETWKTSDSSSIDLEFTDNGSVIARVFDGNNHKTASTLNVEQIDTTPPSTDIRITSYTSKKVSVQGVCRDEESGIVRYRFKNGNGNWINNGTTFTHTFTGLPYNSNQTFYVECKNGSGLTKEASISGKTCNLVAPTYSVSPLNGWATKKTVTLAYTSDCGKNEYSLDGGRNWTTLASGKTIATVDFSKNGSIIARSFIANDEYANASTLSVDQIDNTGPDTTAPTISINNSGKATITFKQTDSESGIDTSSIKYYYKKSTSSSWIKASSNVITGLDEKTGYDFKTEATNNAGLSTISKIATTSTCDKATAPTFVINPGNDTWATKKTVTITYPTKPESCGTDKYTYQYQVTETTTDIKDDKWTTLASGKTTTSVDYEKNGYIIARIYDGSRYTTSSTTSIIKIDTTNPTLTTPNSKSYTSTISLSYEAKDSESGVKSVICEYGTTSSYGKSITGSSTECSFGGLTSNKTYYYKATVTDNVGKTVSKTGSAKTLTPITPTFTTISTPGQISGSNYMTSQTIQIKYDSSNMHSGMAYYFKTTVNATSSVSVSDCGTSTTSCSGSTTSIVANRWYKTTSTTPQITFTQSGSISAQISDGTNYKDASTYTTSYITGTSISDYATSSTIVKLDGKSNSNSSTWTNLANNTSASVSTTSGWQEGVCIAYSTSRAGTTCTERINGVLYFDGVDDYLLFDYIKGKTTFTIEVIYKPTFDDGYNYVMSSAEAAGITIGGNGYGSAYIGNGYHDDFTFTTPTTLNKINYRALSVWDGFSGYGTATTFFNLYSGENTTSTNKFISSHSYPGKTYVDSSAPLVLGCNPANRNVSNVCRDGAFFKGYIYAVRIHNGVLTDQQIAKNAYIDRKRYGF